MPISPRSDAFIAVVDDDLSAREGLRLLLLWRPRWSETAIALAAGLLAALVTGPAHAQSPPSQYIATLWQTDEGLPQNSVNALVQDHDGYLWLGTFGGLTRFDGQRFRVFGSEDLPGLGSTRIISLFESRSGGVWIGTAGGGLGRLEHGVVTTYTERDGLPSGFISSIRGDAEGNVWLNTSGGVARVAGAKIEAYPSHRGKAVREFYLQARDGSLWFRSGQEVLRFGADGSVATWKVPKPSVFLVRETGDGSVWIAARDAYRLVRYHEGVFSDVPLPPIGNRPLADPHPEYAVTIAEDNGQLLLLTPAGLVRTVDGKLSPPEALPLPANGGELPKVRSLLVDREGNLWVGMIGTGLVRIRPTPLTAYAKREGLSDSGFYTVFQDREGRVWLGGASLYWFDRNRFHLLPGVNDTLTIAQTRDGDLWFGGYGGLYRYRSGVVSRFKIDAPAVDVIYQDREGALWIGAAREDRPGGLYRFREGKLDQIPGVSDAHEIIEDRNNRLLAGGAEGLYYLQDDKAIPYEQNRNLPAHIGRVYQEPDGTFWLATRGGGLFRLREGRLKAITSKNGLPNDMLLGIMDDGKGNLWVSSNQNIFRLSLKELNEFADRKISSILPVTYGTAEGMRTSECNGGSPGIWKTTDGRIWFPTLRGVVAIDPAAGSRLPPPVVLEEASANQWTLAHDGQNSAPAGSDTFDFRFTALSLSAPEKVRFRYRLEPYDKDWVDAGTRRTAHYTNMAPGEYSFDVIAANNFGVWNDQGAKVRFVLRPQFYQTSWFYALCAIAFLALVWVAHQFRVRRLHREFQRMRDVIETIPAYVWSALPDGSVDFINQRFLDFSGLSLAQALRGSWEELIHADDRDAFFAAWRAAIASGKAMEIETRVRGADGHYRWLLVRNVPLKDRTGKIVKWYGKSSDIDDRRRAEESLRQSEAYLAEAQRLSHTGSWALDLVSDTYVYVSEEDSRIWGFDPKDGPPSREAVFQRIHPEDRNRCKELFGRSLREKTDSADDYRILLPDGKVKYVHTIRHLVLNDAGDVVKLVGTSVDITERKRAEEERERLRRLEADLAHINRVSMMGELAASVAHEVNQPISGVVSNGSACLRWLGKDAPDIEEAREAARRIVRDGKRAGEIIARIRALTKRAATPIEKLDLNEIIREVLALVGDEVKRKGVTIRTHFADDLSTVSGDRVQLQQVVLNLVMNGIEAMSGPDHRARELAITTRNVDAGQVQVTVDDSGTGLDPNVIDKIFDPFYTTKPGGMGMGLSICRSILQMHGGRIWASADAGRGTSFQFTLPKYHEEESHADTAAV